MAGESAQPINILLSRDELLFVLDTLKASFILGLDTDPMGDRDQEQQSLAMMVASRALRARGLAQLLDNGQIAIHNALIAAVGVCAYPQQTISVYHWPSQEEFTTRYFAHIRGNEVVVHTRPEDVLHLLSRLPSKEYLVDQMLNVCRVNDNQNADTMQVTLPSQLFGQIRQLTQQGNPQDALGVLAQNGVASDSANSLVTTLAHDPHVSVVQTLKRQAAGAVEKKECTIIQNSVHAWLVQPSDQSNATLAINAVSKGEVQGLLAGWL